MQSHWLTTKTICCSTSRQWISYEEQLPPLKEQLPPCEDHLSLKVPFPLPRRRWLNRETFSTSSVSEKKKCLSKPSSRISFKRWCFLIHEIVYYHRRKNEYAWNGIYSFFERLFNEWVRSTQLDDQPLMQGKQTGNRIKFSISKTL